jgi:hypothetical protein
MELSEPHACFRTPSFRTFNAAVEANAFNIYGHFERLGAGLFPLVQSARLFAYTEPPLICLRFPELHMVHVCMSFSFPTFHD